MYKPKKCLLFKKILYYTYINIRLTVKTNKNSDKKGYVYLLGDVGKEFMYKIGVTRGTIERRIKKLQTGNSSELYIVDYFQTEHPFFIEKWMHIKYYNKKILNEWFELTMEDMKNFRSNCQRFEDLYNISHQKNKNLDL